MNAINVNVGFCNIQKLFFIILIVFIGFPGPVFSADGGTLASTGKVTTEVLYRILVRLLEDPGEVLPSNEELFLGRNRAWMTSQKPVVVTSRQHLLELLGASDGDLSKLSHGQQELLGAYDTLSSPQGKEFFDYAERGGFYNQGSKKLTVELQDASGIARTSSLTPDELNTIEKALWPSCVPSRKEINLASSYYESHPKETSSDCLFHELQHLADPSGKYIDPESKKWVGCSDAEARDYGPDGMHWGQERLGSIRDIETRTSSGDPEAGRQMAYTEGLADWRGTRTAGENSPVVQKELVQPLDGIVVEGTERQYLGYRPWDERVNSGDLLRVEMVTAKTLYGMEKVVGVEKLQDSILNTQENACDIRRVVEDVIAKNPEKTAEIIDVIDKHTFQKLTSDELRALAAKGDVSQVDEYLSIRDFTLSKDVSGKQSVVADADQSIPGSGAGKEQSVVADADQSIPGSGAEKEQSRLLMAMSDEESPLGNGAGMVMEVAPPVSKSQLGIQNVKNSLKLELSPKNLLVTAGIAVGVNLISQTMNGEKPSVETALRSVATAEFAGSVIGGTLGAAAGAFVVPFLAGVPVVGALAPVLCAAVGSMVGAETVGELKNGKFSAGNVLKRVDWTGVAGQSVGSLLGTTAALALVAACPVLLPVAVPLTVIGGMAGGVLGNYLSHLIASRLTGTPQDNQVPAVIPAVIPLSTSMEVNSNTVTPAVQAGLKVQNTHPLGE